jgi:general secretion pathway protein H
MSDVAERGFTLLEIVCVLAIIALLAAVLLPFIPHQTSRSRLQAYALQAATLLKADRNAAIRDAAANLPAADSVVDHRFFRQRHLMRGHHRADSL